VRAGPLGGLAARLEKGALTFLSLARSASMLWIVHTPPHRKSLRGWSRWIALACVVGVAAAGGALVARAARHKRAVGLPPFQAGMPSTPPDLAAPTPANATAAAAQSPTVPPSPPAPAVQSQRSRWLALIAVAVLAAVGGALAGRATEPGAAPASRASMFPTLPDPTGRVMASPIWSPPPKPSTPAAVPAGDVVPRDGSVVMIGDGGEQMTISVVRVADPELSSFPELRPATGDRLVSVTVNASNTGTVAFIAQLQKYAWVSDDKGEWYQRDTTMTMAMAAFPDALVEPSWEFARTIVFELPQSAKLTRLRLSLHPSVAAQTAEWTLI
jgi:hypothetical protein